MPQMQPMNWMLLFMFFNLILMMLFSKMLFFNIKLVVLKKEISQILNKKFNCYI